MDKSNGFGVFSGILKTYKDSDIDIPLEALRKYINKDLSVFYNIDAHKMEELVRSVFSDFYPSCKVKNFRENKGWWKRWIAY